METITTWKDLTTKTLSEMGTTVMEAVPNILGAILILIIGWLVTKIIVLILRRILKFAKVDKATEIINSKNLFGKTNFKFNISTIILGFVKWIMFLVFLIVAAGIMNWQIVSQEVGNLLRYLPKLFSAIALFMIGLYIANFVKKAIKGLFDSFDLRGAKIISNVVFYIITIIITITALNQASIDTEIITNNLTVILGAFVAAIALAFGLGSRELVGDILRTSYARRNFEVGQNVSFKNISGTIERIENLKISIKTNEGTLVVPIKSLSDEEVLIKVS
jgi:hypothetical protein